MGRLLGEFGVNEDDYDFESEHDELDDEDPYDLHDYEPESPESLLRWYHGRVL